MLANCPPLGCSHFHTRGGIYSLLSAMKAPFALQPAKELGTAAKAFQCQRLYRAYGEEAWKRAVPFAFQILHDRRAFDRLVRLRSLRPRARCLVRLRLGGPGRLGCGLSFNFLSGWSPGTRDLVTDELFDAVDSLGVVASGERDRDAFHPRTAGAADTVHVIVGLPGNVEVDDVADAFDVEPAGRDVGRDEDRDLVVLEAIEFGNAVRLIHVALDLAGSKARTFQARRKLANRRLSVGEDDRILEFLVPQDLAKSIL